LLQLAGLLAWFTTEAFPIRLRRDKWHSIQQLEDVLKNHHHHLTATGIAPDSHRLPFYPAHAGPITAANVGQRKISALKYF
jgi:hypothetical protein